MRNRESDVELSVRWADMWRPFPYEGLWRSWAQWGEETLAEQGLIGVANGIGDLPPMGTFGGQAGGGVGSPSPSEWIFTKW